jgi:hypothetical protein
MLLEFRINTGEIDQFDVHRSIHAELKVIFLINVKRSEFLENLSKIYPSFTLTTKELGKIISDYNRDETIELSSFRIVKF